MRWVVMCIGNSEIMVMVMMAEWWMIVSRADDRSKIDDFDGFEFF